MTNLAIELLLLIIILVNFGAILTAKIYSQSLKEIQRKILFCSESISNPILCFLINYFQTNRSQTRDIILKKRLTKIKNKVYRGLQFLMNLRSNFQLTLIGSNK